MFPGQLKYPVHYERGLNTHLAAEVYTSRGTEHSTLIAHRLEEGRSYARDRGVKKIWIIKEGKGDVSSS